MTESRTQEDVQGAWADLMHDIRTGVLLTLRNGRPFGSHVPYIIGENWTRVYVHLSRLALHTQHLLIDPRVSLFVAEPDRPEKNPLALRRINLQGAASVLPEGDSSYTPAKQAYLTRFPQAAMMFGFGDFNLWELRMDDAHLVLGFGQAYLSHADAPGTWTHQTSK
ncbi:MAG: pyridoxamine 5'-phosphate oxidase family protein [Nitrospiraceae bacterium]|nr:pyridoxamine 5'-phosphate oxidase family protein [Nitrospiraceae bacterium]